MNESEAKNSPWNDETVYALGLYRMVGCSLGIWPLKCQDFASKIRFLIAIIILLLMNYHLIQEFVNGCILLVDAILFIAVAITITASLMKISVLRIQWRKMCWIVQSSVEDWAVHRDEESRKVMRRHAFIARFVGAFQLTFGYMCTILILIAAPPTIGPTSITENFKWGNSNVRELRNIPMGTDCSVSSMSTSMYLLFYLLRFIQMLYLATGSLGSDSIFFGTVMHLCAQLEVLKMGMSNLGLNDQRKNVQRDFSVLIERHNHLADLVELVEKIFHVILLGQLTASALHIGLLGIEILFNLQDGHYRSIVFALGTVNILLLQLYMYSYAGEYLTSQTREIGIAVYSCPWYDFTPSLMKNVMLIIARSSHSCYLTAGKMFRMNNESFTSLVKAMMSLFSVFKLTMID